MMQTQTKTFETHEDHMKARSGSIGSSDIASIMGLNKWSTPYQVWLKKTGKAQRDEGNKFTKAGHYLEPVVAKYFEDETGFTVVKESEKIRIDFHAIHDFLSCSRDREYTNQSTDLCILECKTTQKKVEKEDFPLDWFSQLTWQLGIIGLNQGSVAWLERGVDFDHLEVDFDSGYFDYMVNAAGEFWNNHILKDIPPEPIRADDITIRWPSHVTGKCVESTPELLEIIGKLNDVKADLKIMQEMEKKCKEQIKLSMRDAEAVTYCGETLITWKKAKDSTRFDAKRFKIDMPDIYEDYLKIQTGSRRFLVK